MFRKKIVSVIAITLIILCIIPISTLAAEKSYVYLSIEKFTIGQGFILEPIRIEIGTDETVQSLLEKTIDSDKLIIVSSQFGDYLDGFKDDDNSEAVIPKYILDEIKNETVGGRAVKGSLLTLDYTSQGGWFYAVNNEAGAVAFGECKLKAGDVVRIMFSVYGYGTDLGFGFDSKSGKSDASYIEMPNRDELIKAVADTQDEAKKDSALAVLQNLESTKTQIDGAVKTFSETTQTPQTADCMLWVFALAIVVSAVVFKKLRTKIIRF